LPERFDVALLDFDRMREGLTKEYSEDMQAKTMKIDVFIDYT